MARVTSNLLKREPWSGLMMGNHAIARAMVECGVQVATTYPGSPTPEIAAALAAVPKDKRPYYFEYSTNEKVALEVATGAALNGHLSVVFFKSVGLNVASDSLIQLPLLELIGGMVVIIGDDPGVNSSQNEQDNRHFARMSYIPILEPATPTEAYEMFKEATVLSKKYNAPVFLRMTTHVCHAKEVVQFGAYSGEQPDWTSRFSAENGPYLPLVHYVFPLKEKALLKLDKMREESEVSRFNELYSPNRNGDSTKRLGVISAGLPAVAVLENLNVKKTDVDVMKLGMSYPLPKGKIESFLKSHDEVLIIEELDRVMENEIKALAWELGATCRIFTRKGNDLLMGELTPDRTWNIMADAWPEKFDRWPTESRDGEEVIPRSAQMCPGCGHRSAYHAVAAALEEDTITIGDIGCHSLGLFPPHNIGEVLICMGHSSGTAAGMSINNDRKVIAFVGDSTLFHAGWPGLINAVINEHPITLIIMENGTTAMTGHQPRMGTGEIGEKIPIRGVLEALGVKSIREVDAYNQSKLTGYVKEAMAEDGFSVIIASHPCMLKFVRTQRATNPDFSISNVEIDQEKCDRSKVCMEKFGCPSFYSHDDGSVTVHTDLCIGDGSCLKTCPVQAISRRKVGGAK